MDLGSQVGAKLGGKIEPRQAKTGQDKGSEGTGRERKRKGRDWKGKVWKSVEGDFLRGGRGLPLPTISRTRMNFDIFLVVVFLI